MLAPKAPDKTIKVDPDVLCTLPVTLFPMIFLKVCIGITQQPQANDVDEGHGWVLL